MMYWKSLALSFVFSAVLASGCGDDAEGMAGSGGTAGTGGTAATGGSGGSPTGSGSATLTIGEETWEFDSFQCAFGYDATQSQIFSFSSNAFGEDSGGARVQFQVDIEDDSGEERFEGAGVIYEISLDDIDDFQNPSVSWQARGPADEVLVEIDGDRVTAQGVFDDGLTAAIEQVPGTVDATCGSDSIRR